VQRHRVCWEVWPEQQVREDGSLLQIGYELPLLGVHDHPERAPMPGCELCQAVYDDLRRIAEWITPKQPTDSRYEVQLFDATLRSSPDRHFRREVSLSLKILHRGVLSAPVDACETECLHSMERKLSDLGARRHSWSD